MKGKLNLFQAAMIRWREMHPYNAVHVVHVPRPLDAPRLEAGIRRRLEELGLTGLGLDRRRLRYEWSGGASAATRSCYCYSALSKTIAVSSVPARRWPLLRYTRPNTGTCSRARRSHWSRVWRVCAL